MTATRLKRILGFGAVAGALYALWRLIETRQRESGVTWEAQPFPAPPRPRPETRPEPRPAAAPAPPNRNSRLGDSPSESPRTGESPGELSSESAPGSESPGDSLRGEHGASWVEPEDGACPVSHPVKAKLSSGIFHAPGAQMYERTRADRCYPDAASAEADGLRASKR